MGEALGKSRSAIANSLRLLQLSKPIQRMLFDGRLTMGHARALLPLPPAYQEQTAKKNNFFEPFCKTSGKSLQAHI